MLKKIPVIGLMSGTSMDGIDASYVYTDGLNLERTGINSITYYQKKTTKLLDNAIKNPLSFLKNEKLLLRLNKYITEDHAKAVLVLKNKFKINPFLIGFHGQTLLHEPKKFCSVQLGSGQNLSEILETNVVCNFRNNDIKGGGQGAPIAPIYHKFIIKSLNLNLPSIIVNIGGISNLSYWDGKTLLGYDIGPGNNLMDSYMKERFNKPFDLDGKVASKGLVINKHVKSYLKNPFFKLKPPKSLDRLELFDSKILHELKNEIPENTMSTLCDLTVKSILKGILFLPKIPKNCILVGGGQNNVYLVDQIKKLIPFKVSTAKELELPGDHIESELIAFLAARKFFNLPSTFPSTTGVNKETILGKLIKTTKD